MKDNIEYIAFFDLDRTLARMNSGHSMVKTAYDTGMIGKRDLLKAVMQTLLYKLRITGTEKMIYGMGRWMKGMNRKTLHSLAEKSVISYLAPSVFEEALSEIAFHRSRNGGIALLSSAIVEICMPLAAYLGIDMVIATEMECREDIYTGEPSGNYCYGPGKRERIKAYCSDNGCNLANAWYYADSISDLPALEVVGNPVCVNPEKKLEAVATERGWKICHWTTERSK